MSNSGTKLSSHKCHNVILTYPDGKKKTFDHQLKTKNGWVAGINAISNAGKIASLAKSASSNKVEEAKRAPPKRDFFEYHGKLRHPSINTARSTAQAHGVALKDPEEQCKACTTAKAHQTRMSKETFPRFKVTDNHLFIATPLPKKRVSRDQTTVSLCSMNTPTRLDLSSSRRKTRRQT